MTDTDWRQLQHQGDDRWRFNAQRAGQEIPFQPGDLIEIGVSYDYLGEIYSATWGGLPCPVRAVVVEIGPWKLAAKFPEERWSPKVVASLLPPFRFTPTAIAFDRVKRLIDRL